MPSKTGGQLAAFIQDTEKAGGPKPFDFDGAAAFWSAAAEFWKDRSDELAVARRQFETECNVSAEHVDEIGRLRSRLDGILGVVSAQALDEGLWFAAQTAAEAYLQQELRALHEAIEGVTQEECAARVVEGLEPCGGCERMIPYDSKYCPECKSNFPTVAVEKTWPVCTNCNGSGRVPWFGSTLSCTACGGVETVSEGRGGNGGSNAG